MQASVLLLCRGSYCWARNLWGLINYLFSLCFLLFGNFSLFKTPFLGQSSLPTSFVFFFFCLLYFFLPVFEDNDLLFWVPDVLCWHSEVVLWNLLSVEMFF